MKIYNKINICFIKKDGRYVSKLKFVNLSFLTSTPMCLIYSHHTITIPYQDSSEKITKRKIYEFYTLYGARTEFLISIGNAKMPIACSWGSLKIVRVGDYFAI